EPEEQRVAQVIAGLEYENLVTALQLALEAQVSILNYYGTLSTYLETTQDQRRGLELGQIVLSRLERYSNEKLATQFASEISYVLENVALWLRKLNQYAQAEVMYQKSLSLWLENR